jgi:hypothetical protein
VFTFFNLGSRNHAVGHTMKISSVKYLTFECMTTQMTITNMHFSYLGGGGGPCNETHCKNKIVTYLVILVPST